jgi:hypothetical protein
MRSLDPQSRRIHRRQTRLKLKSAQLRWGGRLGCPSNYLGEFRPTGLSGRCRCYSFSDGSITSSVAARAAHAARHRSRLGTAALFERPAMRGGSHGRTFNRDPPLRRMRPAQVRPADTASQSIATTRKCVDFALTSSSAQFLHNAETHPVFLHLAFSDKTDTETTRLTGRLIIVPSRYMKRCHRQCSWITYDALRT